MAKYLATFNDTINDIEINGFITMTDKELEQFEELAYSINWDFTYPLANGDELEFSSGEDLLSRIEYKEISNEEYKTLKKVFNNEFGVFIGEEFLEKLIEDEEEESEIDEEGEDNFEEDDEY